ncbi:MAG: methyltransferase domain-containing protein [Flavobacterium sp.]
MRVNTTHRTKADEIMDDFQLQGPELLDALDKIAFINKVLGGNQLTVQGLQKLLATSTLDKVTIVDVGCGNGDMLRVLADGVIKKGVILELIGIDANLHTIAYAEELSDKYPNIRFRCEDIFSESFSEMNYDILLCTLTLHHFKNEDIDYLLSLFCKQAQVGVVINDLHRSAISYRLFKLFSKAFKLNAMSREDGLTSILRGFTKKELVDFSKKIKVSKQTIQWKWAFRYQWIIWK